ncbi:MAG TPA: hypothetical protein PKC69_10580 [Chitinophagaceae bacterium]|nr:hypothetical protein [Chitinophagaceae bacterium]
MLSVSKRLRGTGGIIILGLLFAAVFTSCSKSKSPNPVTIEGTWQGTYGFGTSHTGYQFGFNILPNGIIERIDAAGNVKGTGEWEMQNNILMADFSVGNADFSIMAAFYPGEGRLLGDWGYYPNVDEGAWEMTRAGN